LIVFNCFYLSAQNSFVDAVNFLSFLPIIVKLLQCLHTLTRSNRRYSRHRRRHPRRRIASPPGRAEGFGPVDHYRQSNRHRIIAHFGLS